MTVAAVVLAAGGSTRFAGGAAKLLVPFRGRPLVWWAVEHARAAGLDETVVVGGAVDLRAALPEGVVLLANPRWADGQATSLQVALGHARARGHLAVVVGLGDQPLVPPEAWRAVAASADAVAVATYGGLRRNPVRLGAEVWDRLPVDGDEGARVLMRRCPALVGEVPCLGNPADVDTVEDLARWS
ncbi:MAG: nucleotidyltransferase family protein [Acidimicrobiales bacterium]|nr:nucleotidyltransferase family protein [Acidimicrobiales bacterium]